eukprot:2789196-Rhodomonas_salina.4
MRQRPPSMRQLPASLLASFRAAAVPVDDLSANANANSAPRPLGTPTWSSPRSSRLASPYRNRVALSSSPLSGVSLSSAHSGFMPDFSAVPEEAFSLLYVAHPSCLAALWFVLRATRHLPHYDARWRSGTRRSHCSGKLCASIWGQTPCQAGHGPQAPPPGTRPQGCQGPCPAPSRMDPSSSHLACNPTAISHTQNWLVSGIRSSFFSRCLLESCAERFFAPSGEKALGGGSLGD